MLWQKQIRSLQAQPQSTVELCTYNLLWFGSKPGNEMSSTFKVEHKFRFMAHLGVSPSVTDGKLNGFLSPGLGFYWQDTSKRWSVYSKENRDVTTLLPLTMGNKAFHRFTIAVIKFQSENDNPFTARVTLLRSRFSVTSLLVNSFFASKFSELSDEHFE